MAKNVPLKLSVRKRIHRSVKLAVVPHKANQYRPHLIRRQGIVIILVVLVVTQAIYNGISSGSVLGAATDITSNGLFIATNKERTERGEKPLALDEDLSRAAQLKARDMFANQYWAHTSPSGVTPWYWFSKVGYSYSEAGENLAKNFTTSSGVIVAWMASPTHRDNILKPDYKDVGFAVQSGVLDGKSATIIVALYGVKEEAAQGLTMPTAQLSDTNAPLSFMAKMNMSLQTLNPVALSSIVVLLLAANIALVAHAYRNRLPLKLRHTWYRHHGIYKAIGFVSLAIVIVMAYGGTGQI